MKSIMLSYDASRIFFDMDIILFLHIPDFMKPIWHIQYIGCEAFGKAASLSLNLIIHCLEKLLLTLHSR